jgi:hypothetical protein
LWARLGTVGGTNTYTGYFLDQNPNSHTLGLGMAIGNGSTSGLGSLTQNLVAGDTIVLRVVGYTLTAYVISSGVIKTVFSAAATLLVPQGSIGIGLSITGLAGGWKVTSFGGGTIDSLTPGTHPVGGFGAT